MRDHQKQSILKSSTISGGADVNSSLSPANKANMSYISGNTKSGYERPTSAINLDASYDS